MPIIGAIRRSYRGLIVTHKYEIASFEREREGKRHSLLAWKKCTAWNDKQKNLLAKYNLKFFAAASRPQIVKDELTSVEHNLVFRLNN